MDSSNTLRLVNQSNALDTAVVTAPSPLAPPLTNLSQHASLLFVDSAVGDYQSLIAGVAPGTAVYVLDSTQDAVTQITNTLLEWSGVDSIHIVSHGQSGSLQLGDGLLNLATLPEYASQIQSWSNALSDDADILLYGCDVAAGELGQAFVNILSQLTGADVAASDDLTGSSSQGGDWELEFRAGDIETTALSSSTFGSVLATFNIAAGDVNGLISAIQAANSNGQADTINLAAGSTYTLTTVNSTDTNGGSNGLPVVTQGGGSLTINGNGATITRSAAAPTFRLLTLTSGANLILDNLTLSNGNITNGTTYGGAIFGDFNGNYTLTIRNSTVTGNTSLSWGGAIYTANGTVNIINSTFSNNTNNGAPGGGINHNGGTLNVINSTFSNNRTLSSFNGGGGIFLESGTANVVNSTISGNTAAVSGGGIGSQGTLNLINTTITNNTADNDNNGSGDGGGVYVVGGTVNVRNTIIAGNFDTPNNAGAGSNSPDVFGSFVSQGPNLIGKNNGSNFATSTLVGTIAAPVSAGLSTLANNGGPTQTHALLTGSLAINTGLNGVITTDTFDLDGDANTAEAIPFDQRGNGFARIQNGTVDLGAFELFNDLPPVLNVSGTVGYTENAAPGVVAGGLTITDPDGGNLTGAQVAITTNFVTAEDRLGISGQAGVTSGTVLGLTWNYNTTTGVLALTGTGTAATYQDALRLVTYSNTSENPNTSARNLQFSLGSSLANPTNGHFYEFVTAPGIDWTEAQVAAAGRNYFGLQGYLVTVTSANEQAFVEGKLQGQGWMGASDATTEGDWRWVTGPESGTQFWQGLGTVGGGGGPVGTQYNNWQSGEPNDAGGEDYAHFLVGGRWNDYANTTNVSGYVVEYGGSAGDPTLQITGNVTVNVTAVNDAPVIGNTGNSYTAQGTAFEAIDLIPGAPGVVTINALSSVDDSAAAVDLGSNSFTFYGVTYTGANQLFVNSNSYIMFGSGDGLISGDLSSNPQQPAIAVLPADWYTGVNTAPDDLVLYQFQDLNNDGISDRLIVEWNDIRYLGLTNGGTATFQAILQLNTGAANGAITLNYPDVVVGAQDVDNGANSYVGVKAGGTQGPDRLLISSPQNVNPLVVSGGAIQVTSGFAGSLTTISEDPTTNNGDLVSAIVGNGITDPDVGALQGIAVTAVDNTNGTWEYSTDAGTTWTGFGSLSNTAARLLAPDARIRFVPNANFNGTVSNGIAFRAWDQTTGTAGATADTTTNGGTSAFSSNIVNASITINPVNDNPTLTLPGAAIAYTENDPATILDSTATIGDIDSANFDTGTLTVNFTAGGAAEDRLAIRNEGTAAGQIGVSGNTISFGGTNIGTFTGGTNGSTPLVITFNTSATPAAAQALLRNLTYSNVSDSPSTTARTISVVLTDGDGGTSTAATKNISITAVNDAAVLDTSGNPVLNPIDEDVTNSTGTLISELLNTLGGTGYTDPDGGSALRGIAVTAVDNSNGAWEYSTNGGTAWTAIGTLSESNARLLADNPNTRIRFVPNLNYFGTIASAISFRAWDQLAGSNGGVADTSGTNSGGITSFSSAIETAALTVNPIDDTEFLVTTTADSGVGSLRQAILWANADAGAETIRFTGTTFTDATADVITLTSELGITGDVTILGAGANRLTLTSNAGQPARVFNVTGAAVVNINDLAIANGNAGGLNGGGILNDGGTVSLQRLRLTGNSAASGGAIYNTAGSTLNIANSTIDANTATSSGAGISNLGTLNLVNVTISGNSATNGLGGGIYNAGTGNTTLNFVTIANNTATTGGGINNAAGTVNLRNTLIANNTATNSPDVIGTFVSAGNNLVSRFEGSNGINQATDIVGTSAAPINAFLTGLRIVGGTTPTHRVLPGSPAINAGNNTGAPTTDQRGVLRTVGGIADIGAFEYSPQPDFNLDGNIDLLWRNTANGQITTWQMNGFNYSTFYLQPFTNADPNWQIVGNADFDGDGDPDVVWRNNATGQTSLWEMNGFAYSTFRLLPNSPDANWSLASIADFNGDGSPDLVWRNRVTGQNTIWRMNGFSFSTFFSLPTVDSNWRLERVADFNRDGSPDLIWHNIVTGQSTIWRMNGFSYSSFATLPGPVEADWYVEGVQDFTADGNPDIVWRNRSTGQTSIWRMNGFSYSSVSLLPTVDRNWLLEKVADFNNDGSPDLLWWNPTTGQTTIWRMNGVSYSSFTLLPAQSSNWGIFID